MNLSAKWKKGLKIGAICIGSIAGVIVLALIVLSLILTPKTLTKLVNKYSNEYLNAQVNIDTARLKIFSHFPLISVELDNGIIISKAFENEADSLKMIIPKEADTLLKFQTFSVSFNLPKLIFGKIDIKRFSIRKPYIYAYVSPWGKANWEIYNSNDSTSSAKPEESSKLSLNIRRISIGQTGKLVYDNRPDSLKAEINLNKLKLKGKFTLDKDNFKLSRGQFSKFSLEIEKLSAQRKDGIFLAQMPDSLMLENQEINTSINKTSARFMIDSLLLESGKRGMFQINALTHTDLKIDNLTLAKNFPFEVNGAVALDTVKRGKIHLDNLKLTVGEIPVTFNGALSITADSISTDFLCGKTDNFEIAKLIALIPKDIYPDIKKVKTDAKLIFDIDIMGSYNFITGALPSFEAQLSIPESSIKIENSPVEIKKLYAKASAYYNTAKPDSSKFDLEKFMINGNGLQIDGNVKISDFLNDADIKMDMKVAANLDTLQMVLPKGSDIEAQGSVSGKIKIDSRLSNLSLYNLGNAKIQGDIQSKFMDIDIPSKDICCMIMQSGIKLGTAESPMKAKIKNAPNILFVDFNCDSTNIHYKNEIEIKGSKIKLAGKNSASILKNEKDKVSPFAGEFIANRFEYRGADSLSLRMRETSNKFSIMPYNHNRAIPVIAINSSSRRISMRDKENRISFSMPELDLKAVIDNTEEKARKARREKRLDSLQQIYPTVQRDSLLSHSRRINIENTASQQRRGRRQRDEFSKDDIDIKVDRSLSSLIRSLNLTGSINAQRGRLVTPYFPLKNRLENININLTTDMIKTAGTKFKLGESEFTGTGEISGLKNAMLGRGVIKLDLNIDADTLNINELVAAATKGSEYSSSDQSFKDKIMQAESEDQLQKTINLSTSDSSDTIDLIVVPGNIDAAIKLNAKYGKYSGITLNSVTGELLAKERCLQINNLKALTDAGEMDLTAFYSTKSKNDLSTGFDLELKNMDIKRLINLAPSIDTLLPMLRSFEGTITSQIAATAKMDDKMNIVLPSLKGVARIQGSNMVLLDGETFAEISKKLKFKNREKNIVDNIAVEILVHDNKIDVFPFIMEIDRYRTAISGTHNLDMSFDYHISVLKSPLPIRLGVNVFGNLDDFHFKIGKAKYKNANLPVYTQVINEARLNLRTNIADIYHKGVEAALKDGGASTDKIDQLKQKNTELENSQMERLSVQDSLMLLQKDSTAIKRQN